MKNKVLVLAAIVLSLAMVSCNNEKAADKENTSKTSSDTKTVAENTPVENKTEAAPAAATVEDGPAIGEIETDDFVLKLHKAFDFELAPKAYQPFKVTPGTKLALLDISIRNKKATPYNMGKVLIRSAVVDSKGKKYLSQWVVAAYITDHTIAGHQSEYDALWGDNFGANEFHRSLLIGFDPPKEEKNFKLVVPTSSDLSNLSTKEIKFTL